MELELDVGAPAGFATSASGTNPLSVDPLQRRAAEDAALVPRPLASAKGFGE